MSAVLVYLIGYGGSGKSSAAAYLREQHGFATFTFSSIIREYAVKHAIPLSKRSDYAHVHADIVKEYGWEYLPTMALQTTGDRVCIDDVRSLKYAALIKQAGGMSIAFDCPTEVRFAHVQHHLDTSKYPDTIEAFIQNEREDEEDPALIDVGLRFEIANLMKTADYHIDASKTLNNTFRQLETFITPLLTSPLST